MTLKTWHLSWDRPRASLWLVNFRFKAFWLAGLSLNCSYHQHSLLIVKIICCNTETSDKSKIPEFTPGLFLEKVEEKVGKGKDQQTVTEKRFLNSCRQLWDFWSHLEIFNALLLALKHQLTTWTTLLENPFQIQSTVRSKEGWFYFVNTRHEYSFNILYGGGR